MVESISRGNASTHACLMVGVCIGQRRQSLVEWLEDQANVNVKGVAGDYHRKRYLENGSVSTHCYRSV